MQNSINHKFRLIVTPSVRALCTLGLLLPSVCLSILPRDIIIKVQWQTVNTCT